MIESAHTKLKNEMEKDHNFAWAWHCNIAMPLADNGIHINRANELASILMKHLFGIDTKLNEYYKYTSSGDEPALGNAREVL